MIITICGVAGSGKSTVAKAIAKEFGYKHYSMGDMQRKYAKEKGITIEELGELEAKDDTIDKEIDAMQTKISKEEDNFVIDSWLGYHFIPDSTKIFLECDIGEAAKRIHLANRDESERKTSTTEEALLIIKERMETNRERWQRYYSTDFMDLENYDFVVDTSNIPIVEVIKKIKEFIEDFKNF